MVVRTPFSMLYRTFGWRYTSSVTSNNGNNASDTCIKPYTDIPGPCGPFGLGNLYQYWPIIGRYSWLKLHKASYDKYHKYGPIVREIMVPGQDIIWLYDPDDIIMVLNEREFPQRRSHLALEKFRKDRPHIYCTTGLLPTNGAEWWRLRAEFQKEISAPRVALEFRKEVDVITHEFIEHLPHDENFDILPELTRLNLELTYTLTFGKRLYSFSPLERDINSRSSRLMAAAEMTNSSILPTDQGFQLWRFFPTAAYKRLEMAQEYMQSIAIEMVDEHLANRGNPSPQYQQLVKKCLISAYMKSPKLSRSDLIGIASDLLLAGIDTTSYTSAFAIYHIARNANIQQRLHADSKLVFPNNHSVLDTQSISSLIPYTRAVLKEVFRLNPISIGVGRILNRNMILSGYFVPKGTVVVTQNMTACRLEKNFMDPFCFIPERWLTEQQTEPIYMPHQVQRKSVSSYLVLPFGHGMRACIARRLAEQNIELLLLRLFRNFEVIWAGDDEPLDVQTLLINKPSAPVIVRLKRR